MIDEKARLFARWVAAWAAYFWREVRRTVVIFFSVYFDRVRWIELVAFVSGAATAASQSMTSLNAPQAARGAALLMGGIVALAYLRNPKMASWSSTTSSL